MKKVFGWKTFLLSTESYLEPLDLISKFNSLPEPQLFFGHFGGVHDPIYAQDCEKEAAKSKDFQTPQYTRRFVWSVNCTNKQIIRMLDALISQDSESIVIIQSDHGPGYFRYNPENADGVPDDLNIKNKTDFRVTYGILSAMRLPARCHHLIPEKFTPVNTFRIVISCLVGRATPLKENKTFGYNSDGYTYYEIEQDDLGN